MLEAGSRLGPYEIVALLASGGMGEVYRAHDPRLGRDVAIKVLPDEIVDRSRLRRFEQEARAASATNHPNVLVVYDIGTHENTPYVVSELLEGDTLKARLEAGALPLGRALDYALQITRGLAAAHNKGIVHRDLKPDNVFVTEDGRVKILDFGLAKLTRPGPPVGEDEQTATAPGTLQGTVGYMSPEQVRGEAVDHRSDIFSFGALLFEMLSGRRAFRRGSAVETLNAILREDPPALSGPASSRGLAGIVRRCLEKRAGDRFRSTHDLALALEAVSSGVSSRPVSAEEGDSHAARTARWAQGHKGLSLAMLAVILLAAVGVHSTLVPRRSPRVPGSIQSVAVLPFENVGGDPDNEYLSDGVAETLINMLARLSNLKVMARSSSFRFKGAGADPRQVGRELKVGAVLTGRVSLRGDTLVIAAELIDVAEGTQLWGEQYNRKTGDVLSIQTAIVNEIAGRLGVELSGNERRKLTRGGTRSVEAYDLYLKGLHHSNRVNYVGLNDAARYFQRAVAADPGYALPHVGLANVYTTIGYMAMAKPQAIWPMVKAEASRALELDERLAAAHAALGSAILFYDWDWPAAKRSLDRALELDRDYSPTYHWYAHYWMTMGNMDKALEDSRRAVELAPLDMLIRGHELYFLTAAGRRDELLERRQQAAEVNRDHWLIFTAKGLAYLLEDRLPEAIVELEKAAERSDGVSLTLMDLGCAYAMAGDGTKAKKVIADLHERAARQGYSISVPAGVIHGALGEKDKAFELLEKGYLEHDPFLTYLRTVYWFDGLRADPRYADLVRRVGLP
jgi:serine/threonine protein kinase/tetratricopeptide (TPR) repeat protein